MGQLHDYAEYELKRAGLFDEDSDYGGMVGKACLELVDTFEAQGHSGSSAPYVAEIFTKLISYEPLTPITSDAGEWTDLSKESGRPMWQNNRKPTTFSEDGGTTWYDLYDKDRQ